MASRTIAVGLDAGLEHEHGVHALLAALPRADDRDVAHAGHGRDHALHVLGKDVQPLGRDDHFLLAALDEQPALRVELADVAGVEPAVLERLGGGLRPR